MKKGLAVLGVASVLALAGCNGGNTVASKGRAAFVSMEAVSEYFTQMEDEFKSQFAGFGFETDVGGSFNPAQQVTYAENFLAKNPKYLFIWPVQPDSMVDVVKKAHAQGTKVISFVEEIPGADGYIVTNPVELAGQSVDLAAKWINATYKDAAKESVKVAVVYDDSKANVKLQGEAMADQIVEKCDLVTLEGKYSCTEGEKEGKQWAETWLTAHPDVDVLLSPNCSTALGVNTAMMAAKSANDLEKCGIFTVNAQDGTSIGSIISALENKSVLRGAVNAGNGADGTIRDFIYVTACFEAGRWEMGEKCNSFNTYMYGTQSSGNLDDIVIPQPSKGK